MKKEKLYLVCPDCHVEQAIRNEFGQDAHFLTSLGSVFDFSDLDYAIALNHFVDRELISEIVIVNDVNCTFIRNTVSQETNHHTKAEQKLSKLQQSNAERFTHLNIDQQKELLAKLNFFRQAYELLDVAFIGSRIDEGYLSTSGLLCDQANSRFERLQLTS